MTGATKKANAEAIRTRYTGRGNPAIMATEANREKNMLALYMLYSEYQVRRCSVLSSSRLVLGNEAVPLNRFLQQAPAVMTGQR